MSNVKIANLDNIGELFHSQPLPEFLEKGMPAKEALIDGLLYKRDSVALIARRRHGKTTLASQMAIVMASGEQEFLGYKVPKKRNVVFYYLEDDPTEIQIKLKRQLCGTNASAGFHLYTRRDLMKLGMLPEASNLVFQRHVELACEKAEADVLFLDNLGHLIGADYNNAPKTHELVKLTYYLQERTGVAVVVLAHPRKVNGKYIMPVSIVDSPEQFFEECMGTSHFINSTGSLWGLQRDASDKTHFVGGAQRFEGSQATAELQKNENDRFYIVSNTEENLRLALNTAAREKAWELLPADREFTFTEGLAFVKPVMSSKPNFSKWLQHSLVRLGLLAKTESGGYRKKAVALSAPGIAPALASVAVALPAEPTPGTTPNAGLEA